MSGLNVAVGSEYRMEAYDITAGQEESWATYDIRLSLVGSEMCIRDRYY